VASTGEAQHAKETSTLKEAELENGDVIQVPLFIRAGEVVRIDVATGRYLERVKEKKA
jgi:elongation factor P